MVVTFLFHKEVLDPFPRTCFIVWPKYKTEQQICATVTFSLQCYEQLPQNIQPILVLYQVRRGTPAESSYEIDK